MAWGFSNTGGGVGLKSSDSLLRVIAPAGSTVTITKGAVSKSDVGHENASDPTVYDYYFIIHSSQFDSVNPWTVTATLNGESMSDTVVINASDEYDITLVWLYVIKNGYFVNGYTSAVNMRNGQPVTIVENYNSSGFMRITAQGSYSSGLGLNITDVTKYNILDFNGYVNSSLSNNGYGIVGVYPSYNYNSTTDIQNNALAKVTVTNTTASQKSVDISSVSGSRYMSVAMYITGSASMTYQVFVKELILRA